MPIRNMPLNLLICATVALASACVYAQSSGTPSTAPAASQSAPAPAPADQTKQPAAAASANDQAQADQDCPGPVLHRAPNAGGDICSQQTPVKAPGDETDQTQAQASGKGSLTDPNVNPFPQAQPDKNGMMPGVKAGSIDDVNAVGTRNIGARGMGNWYSTESEIKMGKQYADEIEKSTRFITDPVSHRIRQPHRPEHRQELRLQSALHHQSHRHR